MGHPSALSSRQRETATLKICSRSPAASEGLERWRFKQIKKNTFEQLAEARGDPGAKCDKMRFLWSQTGTARSEVIEATQRLALSNRC